jgi:hypothetical protein
MAGGCRLGKLGSAAVIGSTAGAGHGSGSAQSAQHRAARRAWVETDTWGRMGAAPFTIWRVCTQGKLP